MRSFGFVFGVPLAGVLSSTSLFTSLAHAEPVTSSLSWVRLPGAESCIATSELGARVEAHLGRSALVSASVASISIEGRVTRVDAPGRSKFRAVVGGSRRDGTAIGTREIVSEAGDCRTLDDGLVLVVALMIDPNALTPARASEPSPSPLPPLTVTREIVHERVVVREVERAPASMPWRAEASIAGLASFARLPGAAPGVGLVLHAGPSRLVAFEVGLGVVPRTTLEVDGREVHYGLAEGGLAYCPSVALGSRVDAGGCAGLRLGAIRSSGSGFSQDHTIDRGLVDVGLGPRVTVGVVGPVFVVAQAMALVPLVQQETVATSRAGATVVVDRRSFLGGEAGIGMGIRFSP